MLRYKAPLSWPQSIPVTPRAQQRSDHGFSPSLTLIEALNFLDEEVKGAGFGDTVLYIDIEQPMVERLSKRLGNRTGACLHIKYQGQGYIFTCDRWQKLEHNIYALHLAFRQWRNMERWGVGSFSTLMAGFEADRTPDAVGTSENTLESLQAFGLGDTATLDDAVAIYHRRAKSMMHDSDQLSKLNITMDEIRDYFASKGIV